MQAPLPASWGLSPSKLERQLAAPWDYATPTEPGWNGPTPKARRPGPQPGFTRRWAPKRCGRSGTTARCPVVLTLRRTVFQIRVTAGASGASLPDKADRGIETTLLETKTRLGGRAATTEKDRFLLNQGPHGLYLQGAGTRILRSLGIDPA